MKFNFAIKASVKLKIITKKLDAGLLSKELVHTYDETFVRSQERVITPSPACKISSGNCSNHSQALPLLFGLGMLIRI